MKLQQLRYVLEIVRQKNHLSAAAEALHTSQPGVSRQILLLEAELGFEIFQRTRNRIIRSHRARPTRARYRKTRGHRC